MAKVAAINMADLNFIADPATKRVLSSIVTMLNTRNGQIGNGDEAFVTQAQLRTGVAPKATVPTVDNSAETRPATQAEMTEGARGDVYGSPLTIVRLLLALRAQQDDLTSAEPSDTRIVTPKVLIWLLTQLVATADDMLKEDVNNRIVTPKNLRAFLRLLIPTLAEMSAGANDRLVTPQRLNEYLLALVATEQDMLTETQDRKIVTPKYLRGFLRELRATPDNLGQGSNDMLVTPASLQGLLNQVQSLANSLNNNGGNLPQALVTQAGNHISFYWDGTGLLVIVDQTTVARLPFGFGL